MIKVIFNHVAHERNLVEHLAQNYGIMIEFGLNQHESKIISVDKGDVIIAENLCGAKSVVLKESCTGIWYSIQVDKIMKIRIFTS